jgi:hypothetical protein
MGKQETNRKNHITTKKKFPNAEIPRPWWEARDSDKGWYEFQGWN